MPFYMSYFLSPLEQLRTLRVYAQSAETLSYSQEHGSCGWKLYGTYIENIYVLTNLLSIQVFLLPRFFWSIWQNVLREIALAICWFGKPCWCIFFLGGGKGAISRGLFTFYPAPALPIPTSDTYYPYHGHSRG